MAIRTDENGVRRGNAADAGALCKTSRKADGVGAPTYRRMVSQLNAPGPLKGHNPDNGDVEYDLDAVVAFNAKRPGPGAWHHDIAHRTPMRHEVLSAVGAGRMTALIERHPTVSVLIDGKPFVGRANTRQFSDLLRGGMIEVPPVGGDIRLTAAGRELLAKWDAQEPARQDA